MTTAFHEVADADREALVDFMVEHAPIMMFPLANLNRYGLGGQHPRAISAWVAKSGDRITDVLTWSQDGMVFPCCPSGHWDACLEVLRGQKVLGFLGEGRQATALRQVCGLTQRAKLDALEPSFVLSLSDLIMPDTDGFVLRPLAAAPHDLMVDWRAAYEVETLSMPKAQAAAQAERFVRHAMTTDSHRVVLRDGVPVCMTGFNAMLPEIVQVGGVYTPPEHRGHGYAKVALAQHLMEVAVDGVTEAVLSAANESAARVYTALGFKRTGTFALVIFDTPQVVHG